MPNPNGAVAGNRQNVPEAHTPRTRSTFPLRQLFPNTHRFGEYIPHYVDDLTKGDDYPIHSSGNVRSYTFKSPLLQNVTRNKDYFFVPMEAILPNNWEKFFVNPVRGDDVVDEVGPTVVNFWRYVGAMCSAIFSYFRNTLLDPLGAGSSLTQSQIYTGFWRSLILGEYFYSNGNLLASLNCHGSSYCRFSYDDFFDAMVSSFFSELGSSYSDKDVIFVLQVDGDTYQVSYSGSYVSPYKFSISWRHALQLMRDNPTFALNPTSDYAFSAPDNQSAFDSFVSDVSVDFCPYDVDCNLSRLWAYQLCVSHYMSNDHIDFVYSAELYRQLIGSYVQSVTIGLFSTKTFSRNGISYQYDWLSGYFCSLFLRSYSAIGISNILTSRNTNSLQFLGYFSALFGYRRSLRYLDYFTGSRAQPLAVVNTGQINTNVAVANNQVSVIDITKSIQAQRFVNSVNRIRHQFEGYLQGIFGGELPKPDYHNPFYLAHTDDVIFGQETENTADAQLKDKIAITTNLRGHSGNYMFECHSDRPGIVIGISSYDIARVYQHSMDRSFLHKNRFDWFNPFMQYIGDQPIYLQELGNNINGNLNGLKNFSYTLRHMEFKQKYNYAAGGFCNPSTDLDLWIFGARDLRGNAINISPDWIRSLNAEFDQFYVSLSGWSLGTYWHFIVADYNSVDASRPMAYAPQILG